MTRLLLIRHAVSDAMAQKRLAGWTPGVHLNDEGRAQAEALAERLAKVKIEALYASPLERTLETAEIIAAPHGLRVEVREGLGETRYGTWTGKTFKQLRRRKLWPLVQVYPSGLRFPGGETLREVQARAVGELEAIRAEHPKGIVAAVSHADTIKAAVAHYVGLHLDLFQRLVVSPASLTVLQFGDYGPRLITLNDISHLPQREVEG